jgi:hypothetical protein
MPRQYITCSSCHQIALRVGRGLCRACYNAVYHAGTLPPKPAKPLMPKPPKRPKHTERVARSCGGCGTTVLMQVAESNRTGTAYCSPECRSRRVDHTCPGCGVVFSVTLARLRLAEETFCSKPCWQNTYRRRNHSPAICAHCGNSFLARNCQIKKGRGKYCSFACLKADRTPAFPSKPRLGVCGWRSAVLRRDGHACRQCGATNALHAHHIKPWASYPELRHSVENGVTLCDSCHRLTHKKQNIPGLPI